MLCHLSDCFEAVCLCAGNEENISFMIVWYLLAHLAEGHESLCHGAASFVCPSGVNFFL